MRTGSATEIYNKYAYIRELRRVLSNCAAELTRDQQTWSFAPYHLDKRVIGLQIAA